jgi:hypothetical protein
MSRRCDKQAKAHAVAASETAAFLTLHSKAAPLLEDRFPLVKPEGPSTLTRIEQGQRRRCELMDYAERL